MPRPQSHIAKRKELRRQVRLNVEEDALAAGVYMRTDLERRSKSREDLKGLAATRSKAPARHCSPPPKKRRVITVESEFEEEKDDSSHEGRHGADFVEQSWSKKMRSMARHHLLRGLSQGYEMHSRSGGGDSDGNTDDAIEAVHPVPKKWGTSAMKKPIEVDGHGQPFGSMKEAFSNDVKKYAKDLDPRIG